MNDNKQTKHRPTTDDSALSDVEAHGFRGNAVPEDDDTEGHAIRSGRALPDDKDDTEGHGFRGNALPDDENTEGHGIKYKGVLPEDADTEGHGAYSNRALPDDDGDDTEGHGVRVRI